MPGGMYASAGFRPPRSGEGTPCSWVVPRACAGGSTGV